MSLRPENKKSIQETPLFSVTKNLFFQHHLSPDLLLHQNFCVDEDVLAAMVDTGEVGKEDVILEIGAGTGLLTAKLAEKAKKVIAAEKDEKLKPLLQKMPKNVEIIFSDALKVLPKIKEFNKIIVNKIIANIPYQLAEPLLRFLCTAQQVERTVLMVPRKFAVHAAEHPFFSAFFNFKVIADVPREAFYPQPKVVSAILLITPKKEVNGSAFLLRQLFLQRDKKLKNALREGLIAVAEWQGKKLSKKEATQKIDQLGLSEEVLEELVGRVKLKKIGEIVKKIWTD
ncbi:hypothetical protein HYX13_03265 [Candidatus Woesearchaeota archaeon]|nr:hypothetical protein [Candidatus Woesearchaeota archaeon]